MPNILIRDLDAKTIRQLKARAAAKNRSLQTDLKELLERVASEKTVDELRRATEDYAKRFKGRKMADTVKLLREDRGR